MFFSNGLLRVLRCLRHRSRSRSLNRTTFYCWISSKAVADGYPTYVMFSRISYSAPLLSGVYVAHALLTTPPVTSSPAARTLGAWCLVYDGIIGARRLKPCTLKDKRNWLRTLVAEFGHRSLDSVMPYEIAQLASKVQATGKETKARRIVIEAKDFFNEALLAGWCVRNPADAVRPVKPRIKRKRLMLSHWQSMLEAANARADPMPRLLLRLALVTGQRRADLAAMRFDDVKDGLLRVAQRKTGRLIALPLSLRLEAAGLQLDEVLEECRLAVPAGDTVLRKQDGSGCAPWQISLAFVTLRTEVFPALWPGVGEAPSLHEVRSLSERMYRAEGIDTQTLLGHKFPSTTNLYNDDRGATSGEWKVVGRRKGLESAQSAAPG